MASILAARAGRNFYITSMHQQYITRMLMTAATTESSKAPASHSPLSQIESSVNNGNPPNTHYKITLRRSAISLGDKIKGTLVSLGIHRRHQTVYHRHSPETAGKILKVKELLEVENVPEHLVKTKQQQREDRKATRGYKVVGTKKLTYLNI